MAQTTAPRQVKVVILGDSGTLNISRTDNNISEGVGKSSIMLRFVTGSFQAEREPTLGGAFMAKLVNNNGMSIKYQVKTLLSLLAYILME